MEEDRKDSGVEENDQLHQKRDLSCVVHGWLRRALDQGIRRREEEDREEGG